MNKLDIFNETSGSFARLYDIQVFKDLPGIIPEYINENKNPILKDISIRFLRDNSMYDVTSPEFNFFESFDNKTKINYKFIFLLFLFFLLICCFLFYYSSK